MISLVRQTGNFLFHQSTMKIALIYHLSLIHISLSDNEEKTVGIHTIYEITERTIDRYGQYFIVPDIELGTYWTNTSRPDETVIDLYHAHGESEQYHSEIKTDMDVERLPSGKFESNKLVLELTMIAYNILRIIGQESLKKKDAPGRKKIHRRRIRTVISNLMQFAGHLTEHAGRLVPVSYTHLLKWARITMPQFFGDV